jgi:plastocyanin
MPAVLVVLVLLAVACGSNSNGSSASGGGAGASGATSPATSPSDEEGGGTITLEGQTANDHGSKDVSGQTDISLELDNEDSEYYFSPTVLKGSPGQEITIELENEGSTEHNFSLTDQGIDQNVDPDGKAEVSVAFPKSGTIVFFCAFHAQLNMRGALEVS